MISQLAVALIQGVIEDIQLLHRQAKKPRVQASWFYWFYWFWGRVGIKLVKQCTIALYFSLGCDDIMLVAHTQTLSVTSTTEGRSGGAVCVFILILSSFLTSSSFFRLSLVLGLLYF